MNSIRPLALLVHAILTAWPFGVYVLYGLVYLGGFARLSLLGFLGHFLVAAMLLREDAWRWRVALGAAVVTLLNVLADWSWSQLVFLEAAGVAVVVWARFTPDE